MWRWLFAGVLVAQAPFHASYLSPAPQIGSPPSMR
jgi:hypothetical protein